MQFCHFFCFHQLDCSTLCAGLEVGNCEPSLVRETAAANGGKNGFCVARFKLFGRPHDDAIMRESWNLQYIFCWLDFKFGICASENHPFSRFSFSSHPIGKSVKTGSGCGYPKPSSG